MNCARDKQRHQRESNQENRPSVSVVVLPTPLPEGQQPRRYEYGPDQRQERADHRVVRMINNPTISAKERLRERTRAPCQPVPNERRSIAGKPREIVIFIG